jgi:hypothetical protein
MYVAALLLVLTIIAMNDIAFVQLSCRRVHPSQPSLPGVSWGSTRQVFLLVLLHSAIVIYLNHQRDA